MKTTRIIVAFLLFAMLFISFPEIIKSQPEGKNFLPGNWKGQLVLPMAKVEVIFKISMLSGDSLAAKLDVPAQGAFDLPVSGVKFQNDSLFLDVKMIKGKFSGVLSEGKEFSGTWSQGGANFPLTLKKSTESVELNRPQNPQKPYPYSEEEVVYLNKKSGFKLAGTFCLPANTPKSPAVILISGSGAQDRDESLMGHRPFLVLADYLVRRGIAVLRVDDRGVGGSEGNTNLANSDDYAGDVLAGIEFLKSRNEIDVKRIGLIGHSEGGIVAPIAANLSGDVAFIVLMAGPGIKGEELLYQQGELLGKAAGLSDEMIEQRKQGQKAIFDIVKNEPDSAGITERLRNYLAGGDYASQNEPVRQQIDQGVGSVNSRWFRYFLVYDPYPALAKVKCPVLAINGEKDLQVPAKTNLSEIGKALAEGGNKNFKLLELEGLNHLFQTCQTGGMAEYAQIEETISPKALQIIGDWILEVVK